MSDAKDANTVVSLGEAREAKNGTTGENVARLSDYSELHRTPAVVLEQLLSQAHRMKSMMVVIQWDDERYGVDMSPIEIRELAFHAAVLRMKMTELMNENTENFMVGG